MLRIPFPMCFPRERPYFSLPGRESGGRLSSPKELIAQLAKNHDKLLTIEENIGAGGFGMNVLRIVNENRLDIKIINASLPDEYIQHGSVTKLKEAYGFTPDAIIEKLDSY